MLIHKPRFKLLINKEFLTFSFAIKKPQWCFGIQNKIGEYEYIPFFDFDDSLSSEVENFSNNLYELNERKYGYSILQSSTYNYHVIFWKIVTRDTYLHYLVFALSYGMDKGYISLFLNRDFSILRFSPKGNKKMPKTVKYVKGENDEIVMSKLYNANKQLIAYTTFNY